MFIERFTNKNDFSDALHEDGIAGVAQDDDNKGDDNDNENSNTNEDPDDPTGIFIETAAVLREITVAPPIKPSGTLISGSTRKPSEAPRSGPTRKRGG